MSGFDPQAGISFSNLMHGFGFYLDRLKFIAQSRLNFPISIDHGLEGDFKSAFYFACYGVIISFILLLPSYLLHDVDVQKWSFFLRFICNMLLFGVLAHYIFRIFGKKSKTLVNGLVLYFHLGGVGMPLYMLLALPLTVTIGPMAVLGGIQDSDAISKKMLEDQFFMVYFTVLTLFTGLFSIVLGVSWYSKFYGMGYLKAFLLFLVLGAVVSLLSLIVINPLFNATGGYIEQIVGIFL